MGASAQCNKLASQRCEENSQDERILHFGMLCKKWDVNIEVVFDEYENYEQYNFGIKEFGGYYN